LKRINDYHSVGLLLDIVLSFVLTIKKAVKGRLSKRIVKPREAQYNMALGYAEKIGVSTSSDGRANSDSLATHNSMDASIAAKIKGKSM
jgi:hypothetical protein